MSLKDDKQQNIQMELDFSSALTGAARGVAGEETESSVATSGSESPARTNRLMMALSLDEFLRRFLLHLLPKGFVRIRHFGFLASRRRAQLLPLCLAALDWLPAQPETATSTAQDISSQWFCPRCGRPMVIIERLTAAQIQLRSPPKRSIAAA